MTTLKPWYTVVTPREDLREGKPLDASEFAVHLDQVREGRAPDVYQKPVQFFDRTYLTKNLTALAAEVARRLSGEKTETSPIFNLVTQFGGGKTHALTLLYHLAQHGREAEQWNGVQRILQEAQIPSLPSARVAVFVGQRFDPRGGDDGTPLRRTPWGEIAWQLAGNEGHNLLATFDEQGISPGGDTIARLFQLIDQPIIILMDELMNYVSRFRRSGLSAQLYNFLQNLSEEARGHDGVVVAVSIPASELEMTAEDQMDYDRFKKLLDRLGKAVIMSAEHEVSEIIRRRLFEWHGIPLEARRTAAEYASWILDNRQQIPNWFPIDHAQAEFEAAYPFHPSVLSVFERKWQALPRFQQTRGVLRLLALWVSRVYRDGYTRGRRDPLIGLGTAPLDDPLFRAAVFEQLGETRLEGAVTTDIAGKPDSHATRLDSEAPETIRKAQLHRKVATVIFFESNGGQMRAEATVPEIRLGVAEPELDIGNVETALETLGASCYYLHVERNRYRFGPTPNLNKLLADRRATIQPMQIEERVRAEIQRVFAIRSGVAPIFFPERSGQIPDRPALTFVILSPEYTMQDRERTLALIESMTRESGTSARTFKSALIWSVADAAAALHESARNGLAWEDIRDEALDLHLDESQHRQLAENLKRAQRDLTEAVWRSYKNVVLLGKDNTLRVVDLGLVTSSAADTMVNLILYRLQQNDDVVESVSPNFLARNWPPAFKEWRIKDVRNAFFASPQFPRLLKTEAIKETIALGVSRGIFAYVGKTVDGAYNPLCFEEPLSPPDVEISDDMYIIPREVAEAYRDGQDEHRELDSMVVSPGHVQLKPGGKQIFTVTGFDQLGREVPLPDLVWSVSGGTIHSNGVFQAGPEQGIFTVTVAGGKIRGSATIIIREGAMPPPPPPLPPVRATRLSWTGQVPAQKWMNFYTKVLSKFAVGTDLRLTVRVEVTQKDGISEQKIEETKVALRELGLNDEVREE